MATIIEKVRRLLVERFPDQIPRQYEDVNLMFIPQRVLTEIILLLNIKDIISGKDFLALGNHFGLNMAELLNIEKYPEPARAIMFIGSMKKKSFLNLLVFLVENKIDGQESLITSWPDTLRNYQNHQNGRGQNRVQGRFEGQGQFEDQFHITRGLEPTEASWNCQSSISSSFQNLGQHNNLSPRDLEYAESVFSDTDNAHYPSAAPINDVPIEDSTNRTSEWINVSVTPATRRRSQRLRRNPVENSETFEMTSLNISNSDVLNIRPEQGLNIHQEVGNLPRVVLEFFDEEQTISKSLEVDRQNPTIVTAIVHRENLPTEMEDIVSFDNQLESRTSFPGNSQSDLRSSRPGNNQSELISSRPGNSQSELRSSGNSQSDLRLSRPGNSQSDLRASRPGNSQSELRSSLPGNSQSDLRSSRPGNSQSDLRSSRPVNSQQNELDSQGNSQQDELDSQGFYPPSIVSSSHFSQTNRINDRESVMERFLAPSIVSETLTSDRERNRDMLTSDLEHDQDISLGEDAEMIPSILEKRTSRQVLVASVCDVVTSNTVKDLLRDLKDLNIGYISHLAEGLKVHPRPNSNELRNICLEHKTWLKNKFHQCHCIVVIVTENYLEYVKPTFNWRNIFHTDHRCDTQKLIYKMVKKEFGKKGTGKKLLLPVLIKGSKPTHVPEWISSRFILYKYDNEGTSNFMESPLCLKLI